MTNRSLVGLIVVSTLNAPPVLAQFSTDWQTRAGGAMAFEVASIKPSSGKVVPSNIPLTPWDDYSATTGRFLADATLSEYIQFAYKLWPDDLQSRAFSRLPKWVASDRYSIEARAAITNPTKDQIRLMVQSLLADRFHLSAHFDTQEAQVFELKLAEPGKLGPKLVSHADGPPCDKPGRSFPADCHSLMAIPKADTKLIVFGSRDVTMDVLAGALCGALPFRLGRPVIDKTGLTGTFDFTLEWLPESRTPPAADLPVPAVPDGPAPLEALRDQLGLKLEAARVSLPILVIDRVERPSQN